MPSISSLLRGAESTRKKIRAQDDAYAAFEWENSAQTAEDFQQYQTYLEGQQSKTRDPSDLLTYESKIRSARRSFISNELQREQMKIMEGAGTTQSKMDAVRNLFQLAIDNQDLNTAQNLMSQWDSLSIKLQNEQEAAAKAFASAGKKVTDDLISDLTKGVDDITLPTGEKVTPLAQIARDLELGGGDNLTWRAASDTLEAIRGVIIDKYNNARSQEEIESLEEKYGAGLQDIDKKLAFKVGGMDLNYQDVINAEANESLNNPVFSLKATRNEVTGENEYKLQRNNVERLDYVRQFDEQGNEYFVPATIRTDQGSLYFGSSDQGRNLTTQLTDKGEVIGGGDKTGKINAGEGEVERNNAQSVGNRLKSLGIIARDNGTTLAIKLPGESVERQATIQPDGSLRYYGDDGNLIEIGLVDRQLGVDGNPNTLFRAGQTRVVSPEEVSDFGKASAFGGTLSRASATGERYVKDILGKSPVERTNAGPLAGPISVGNDFRGFGTAVTSGLLQAASTTRKQIQLQQQAQQMLQAQEQAAARLQATPTFNLNQTPIRQMTADGIRVKQLQVAAPTAQPRVYVQQPLATPKVSVAPVAPASRIGGVGVSSGSTRRVTVR